MIRSSWHRTSGLSPQGSSCELEGAHRQRDALNAERHMLPIVEIDKQYVFEAKVLTKGQPGRPVRWPQPTPDRPLPVAVGRRPEMPVLLSWSTRPATSPTYTHSDTSLVVVTREPLAKSEPFRKPMGWTVPDKGDRVAGATTPEERPKRREPNHTPVPSGPRPQRVGDDQQATPRRLASRHTCWQRRTARQLPSQCALSTDNGRVLPPTGDGRASLAD